MLRSFVSRNFSKVMSHDEGSGLIKKALVTIMLPAVASSFLTIVQLDSIYAGEISDEMKKMQEQLNNRALSKPLSVTDEAQVKSYISEILYRGCTTAWRSAVGT